MSDFVKIDITIDQLCDTLEWSHKNALKACMLQLSKVELDLEEREDLNKIYKLRYIENRVQIKKIESGCQQWYHIFVDEILIASAYIDDQPIVGKSYWNIFEEYKEIK